MRTRAAMAEFSAEWTDLSGRDAVATSPMQARALPRCSGEVTSDIWIAAHVRIPRSSEACKRLRHWTILAIIAFTPTGEIIEANANFLASWDMG